MKYNDIIKFPHPNYTTNVSWEYVEEWLKEHQKDIMKLDLDPEFQRGYVWTEEQKVNYIEYALKGGFSGRDIYFNCPTWMKFKSGKEANVITLIDGKQRLNAVLDFLNNKIKVYGDYYKDYEVMHKASKMRLGMDAQFIIHVHNIPNEIDVVKWYIGMNKGGTAHTDKDINVAKQYLKKLEGEYNAK
jgi:uncharacterized protein with ParB-like and HNH nuclease domain